MPNDDLKDDIAAAFDAADSTPEPTTPTDTPAPEPVEAAPDSPVATNEPIGETAAEKEARQRDEKGRFAKAPEEGSKPKEAAPKAAEPAPVEPAKPVEAAKPPQSWRPALREKFAALPPEVQQEVVRREREIATTMQETAEARQGYQRFRETVAPFEHMIRASGADPYQTISQFLQTGMALASGAQGTKAGVVANLIKFYGVDVAALANALEGQPQAQQAAPEYRDPRVDQLLSQVEQAKQQRQQVMAQEATRLISEIEGEEFFGDVKDAMADILEIAAKRGVAMTPREAYNRAVWADPHVAEVLQQRQRAKQAQNPNGSTARAALAAASVKGSPAVGIVATQPGNLRGDIEAALDRLRDG